MVEVMCRNEDCPLRKNCFRYRARPRKYHDQIYGDFHPMGNGQCPDFLDCSEYVESRLVPMKELEPSGYWRD